MADVKPRDIIVVDIETTGLHQGAAALEVAAINLTTGEEFNLIPYVDPANWQYMQPKAMEVNRYFERGIWQKMESPSNTRASCQYLADMLRGNTFAGCNPAFDAYRIPVQETWHHRLLDLSAYAAGVLGITPCELPGLNAVCERLGVTNEDPHSALGDARATAECFYRLFALKGAWSDG